MKLQWDSIRQEAEIKALKEPVLADLYNDNLLQHDCFSKALVFLLSNALSEQAVSPVCTRDVITAAIEDDPRIVAAASADLYAIKERDSACKDFVTPFLYFKGFHALQSYRISHWLWNKGRESLAQYFQHRISMNYGVDIHPAARLGCGVMIDHATGVVIGETAVVGNNVSIMQSVTLGGTGKESGDRHPKIGHGVLISSGAKVLGNIRVGDGAKVGAGSIVLQDVPAHTTVVGVPAKKIGKPLVKSPALDMSHLIHCDIENCSDMYSVE